MSQLVTNSMPEVLKPTLPPEPTVQLDLQANSSDPLVAQLAQEMARRWHDGECHGAEEFFDRHPELRDRPDVAVRLVYEEICLRQARGEDHPSVAVAARFPELGPELQNLLYKSAGEEKAFAARMPAPGETFGDFLLLAELGKGRWGRVFLATQPALADRPVVLKVTPCEGLEHLSLARLQHTHVVPIYAVQEDPIRKLRILVMPYFGGATLAQLLGKMACQPVNQRSGHHFLNALDQIGVQTPIVLPVKGPGRQRLSRASYTQALCYMGLGIADALHYAHERGLVHLDVKPSNVLVAADGEPMLLDFHLAQGPLAQGKPAPLWLGGTPYYMPPEQKAALKAVRQRTPIAIPVDRRCDIYALGVILYEALGGPLPLPEKIAPPLLGKFNAEVSPGLEDVIHQCLALDPRDRYPSAAALAADLGRHLGDLPLQGVSNRSWQETWDKWRRRRPHALALLGMKLGLLAAVLIAVTGVLAHVAQQVHMARAALEEGQDHRHLARAALLKNQDRLAEQEYEEAIRALTRGRLTLPWPSVNASLANQLDQGLHAVSSEQTAQKLHLVVDQLRWQYGVGEKIPSEALKAQETACRMVWERRDMIQEFMVPGLEPELQERTRHDLLDLAILWGELRVRMAPPSEEKAVRRQVLENLDEVARHFGPEGSGPQTAWGHYARGGVLLRAADVLGADREFQRAILLQPNGLWPQFYHGVCTFRLGQYPEAEAAFRIACALAPRDAEPFFNLGVVHRRQQRYDEALADLSAALERLQDPPGVPISLEPAMVHFQMASIYLAQQNRSSALDQLEVALKTNPGYKEANDLYTKLRSDRLQPSH